MRGSGNENLQEQGARVERFLVNLHNRIFDEGRPGRSDIQGEGYGMRSDVEGEQISISKFGGGSC